MTTHKGSVWVCLVDGRRARLLRAQRSGELRHWRFDVQDVIDNQWSDFHERGHATAIAGARAGLSGGHAGLRTIAPGHESDEMRSRWAREIAHWIDRQCAAHSVERLTLFAPPATLGAVRGLLPASVAPRVHDVAEDLGHVEPKDAAAHPAIAALLPEPA
jgi:protein required for attachment to host cells